VEIQSGISVREWVGVVSASGIETKGKLIGFKNADGSN
jgi:hypothetical protein